MPRILPFRGIRYDESAAGKLDRLMSPPYDVIDADMFRELAESSPYNVVRLILAGPPVHGEAVDAEAYRNSMSLFDQWLQDGALKRDDKPALYIYEQDFRTEGKSYTRTGLVALVDLAQSSGNIRGHENTLAGPRADRLNHLRAMRANFGQIFTLYDDHAASAVELIKDQENSYPLGEAADIEGVVHRIRTVTSPELIGRLQTLLRDAPLLIADGHHRFETALNYMRENPDSPAARWCMMTLVSMKDPGLLILPTHRLIHGLPEFATAGLLKAMEEDFEIHPVKADRTTAMEKTRKELAARRERGETAFGIYTGGGKCRLAVKRTPPRGDDACARLDVSVLHNDILDRILGINAEKLSGGGLVEYIKDSPAGLERAIASVESGESQALFLVNPPLVEDVAAVAAQGSRMPQKSTFFYPKVFTGLVIRPLDDDEIEQSAGKL